MCSEEEEEKKLFIWLYFIVNLYPNTLIMYPNMWTDKRQPIYE